jgi:hypothetical protein
VNPGSIPGRSIHNPPHGTDPERIMLTVTATTAAESQTALDHLKVGDVLSIPSHGVKKIVAGELTFVPPRGPIQRRRIWILEDGSCLQSFERGFYWESLDDTERVKFQTLIVNA